ncbi:unnamed protein product [Rhizoctonia solani]|uniref:T6SS Phospholipase effector Tle1-like catalytic domain-containing protein n=1 Tax=Rhizoctonia solani TaxID=456999 RepID=A0A8H3CVQ2_9AGAM|nr:unnamed protein product [Rhizoctonia solani]
MASHASRAFLSSYEKYSLRLEVSSDDNVFIIADPDESSGYVFDDQEDARFSLSAHIGVVDKSLVWGLSGFQTSSSEFRIWNHTRTRERYLQVTLNASESNPKEEREERFRRLNLDDYLDIVEYYHADSVEFRHKLGLKPVSPERSIILCFDGTSNQFSNQNTNVVKLVELLKKDDPERQMVYYQAGVGTYAPPGLLTSMGLNAAAKADQGVAWFLYQHVIDGYKYLMETYRAGDQVCIFGFSRGAYTARALAEQVPFAYQIYEASEKGRLHPELETSEAVNANTPPAHQDVDESALPKNIDPERFKITFCIPIKIAFLGVWDTVGSVGAFRRKTLPWIEYNPSVQHFRQALALDENRGNFIPSVWDHSRTKSDEGQSALEVWFKGGHSDIGGGAPPSETINKDYQPSRSPRLSNITLRWMVRQCLTCDGVRVFFDRDAIHRYRKAKILENHSPWATESELEKREKKPELLIRSPGVSVSELLKRFPETKGLGTELEELEATYEELQGRIAELDDFDITHDTYKALDESRWWPILEYLPVPKLSQRESERSNPKTVWSPNMNAARTANRQKPTDLIRLHCSVYRHIKTDTNQTYKPAVEWYNWPKDEWPRIEEGIQRSQMSATDPDSEAVRARLTMIPGPLEPKAGKGVDEDHDGWFSGWFSGWFQRPSA